MRRSDIVYAFVIRRYGLPVNFQAMLLQPNRKNVKKLREVLYDLYKHLDSSAAAIIDVSSLSERGTQRSSHGLHTCGCAFIALGPKLKINIHFFLNSFFS